MASAQRSPHGSLDTAIELRCAPVPSTGSNSLPLAYLAGRRMGGRVLGAIALGVFALTPFLIRYGTEARMYSLVSLWLRIGSCCSASAADCRPIS